MVSSWRLIILGAAVLGGATSARATKIVPCTEFVGGQCFCGNVISDHAIIGKAVTCQPQLDCIEVVQSYSRSGVAPFAVGEVVHIGIQLDGFASSYLAYRAYRPEAWGEFENWAAVPVPASGMVQIPGVGDRDAWCQEAVPRLHVDTVAPLLVADSMEKCVAGAGKLPKKECNSYEPGCAGGSSLAWSAVFAVIACVRHRRWLLSRCA